MDVLTVQQARRGLVSTVVLPDGEAHKDWQTLNLIFDALLAKGLEFSHSHHCPHGRPSALVFSKTDLEKQFGRI